MVKYELKYFNVKARAEIIRMILTAANQPFTDTRLDFADWPKVKESTPGKALPVLIVDDKHVYTQSNAIARYLGKTYGLYSDDPCKCYQIDEVVDCLLDLFECLVRIKFSPESMKEEMVQKYKTTRERIFPYLESKIEDGKHNFVGNSVTIADLACYVYLETAISREPELLKDFPKLTAVIENVAKLPLIAEYLKKRPVTEF
ncbi:glutathione S-transferase-like isoform X2 [Argonauta hians]